MATTVSAAVIPFPGLDQGSNHTAVASPSLVARKHWPADPMLRNTVDILQRMPGTMSAFSNAVAEWEVQDSEYWYFHNAIDLGLQEAQGVWEYLHGYMGMDRTMWSLDDGALLTELITACMDQVPLSFFVFDSDKIGAMIDDFGYRKEFGKRFNRGLKMADQFMNIWAMKMYQGGMDPRPLLEPYQTKIKETFLHMCKRLEGCNFSMEPPFAHPF